jgi:hypothetical protein
MKYGFVVLLIFLCAFTQAQELEFIAKRADCYKSHDDGKHEFKIGGILKNVSDLPLTVATSGFTTSVNVKPGKPFEFSAHIGHSYIDGVPVVPSASDLRLITINPGEAADFGYIKLTDSEVRRTRLVYSVSPHYSDRYGYWSGTLESEYFDVGVYRECTL